MHESTTVFGIDFTSAPSPRKPITCARARFNGSALSLQELVHLYDFDDFEALLETPGPWWPASVYLETSIDRRVGSRIRLFRARNIRWNQAAAARTGSAPASDPSSLDERG